MTGSAVRFNGVPSIAPNGIILTHFWQCGRLIHNEGASLWTYTIALP
jgi:hypothetical protein